ncbi:DNA primase [Streptomyces sp. NPDC006193]|uniref:DNA primase n=1 Tax=Streptomyces sp. NPDC006193 TaxID=3155717 RepID=UPI0033A4E1F3
MNRTALGLAVGAGYMLGRTKKLKLALAVGSFVAGKKMNLGPRALADQLSRQLRDNPQFKEIGDQLRGDLRGVGKAATGAMVERQISSLADRLHGRTAQVRDQLSGVVPGDSGEEREDAGGAEDTREGSAEETPEPEEDDHDGDRDRDTGREGRGDGSRGAQRAAKPPVKKAPAKKAAAKKTAPAKKTAAKKTTAAGKTAGKKTAGAGDAARRAAPRRSKGGDDR